MAVVSNTGTETKKSGSYDPTTGKYSITDNETGKTITGQGTQDDYNAAFSNTGGNSKGSSSGNSYSNYSDPDLQSYIKRLSDAQLAAQQAANNKARDDAISGYNQQIDAAPETYQPLRNQAALTGAQNLHTIDERMASQGNWRSGSNQSAQTANSASTANAIAGYNQQQQDLVNKLRQAIQQVNTDTDYANAQAVGNVNADKLQALINQANSDRSYQFQENQFGHQLDQDTFNNGINAAQVTGYIPNSISSLYPAWNVPAKTYGMESDVEANPGINLYVPGQTQLNSGDIFLGGTGTGVTDAQLNGARRIAGNTTEDTSALYRSYLNSLGAGQSSAALSSSVPSYIAQQFPGATDIVNTGNGMYRFRDSSGNVVYFNAG